MKDWLKILGLLLIAFAILYGVHVVDARRQHRANAKCALSDACLDNRAAVQSMRSVAPIAAPNNTHYFRGIKCTANCDEIVSGYRWAENVGLTNEKGCDELGGNRRDGCLAYYSEFVDSQHEPDYDGPE